MTDDDLIKLSKGVLNELEQQGHSPNEVADILIWAFTILHRLCGGTVSIEQAAEAVRREIIDADNHLGHPREGIN